MTMRQIQDKDPKCDCNHGIESFWVSTRARYPALSFMIGLILGMAPTGPNRIEWWCRTCGTIIAVSKDLEMILAYKET